jgi:cobalt/nickel transport system ATP-binding protein
MAEINKSYYAPRTTHHAPFTNKSPVIEIQNLSFHYPDGARALEGVTLAILEGESLAIVGPNGAGKSTLIFHLNGVLRGNGAVRIMGEMLNGQNLKAIRRQIGIVFQNPDDQLFCPTVFDDVAFGLLNYGVAPQQVHERVKTALDMVGMSGYEKKPSAHLSFGEKKRIAIATVLSMEPEIFVFDEPTSNLDPRGKRLIVDLIGSLKKTLIIVTHDLKVVEELCKRTIILNNGRIVADGDTATVLADTNLIRANGLSFDKGCV